MDCSERYADIRVHGVIGDFMVHLGSIPPSAGRRLVIFLGSTIGNLDVPERLTFLKSVRGMLGPERSLYGGHGPGEGHRRYRGRVQRQSGGFTASNRNVLRVVNRELNANFVPVSLPP